MNLEHCSESSRLLGHPEFLKEAAECVRPASSISAIAVMPNEQCARQHASSGTIGSAAAAPVISYGWFLTQRGPLTAVVLL